MTRVELEPGYVLHCRAWRETSAIVEALSTYHGRVGLVARGARGERSRLRGVLQPFVPLLLSWRPGRDLGTLTAAEPAAPAVPLTGRRVYCGLYMNELLMRLLHRHDPHPELFAAYREALEALAATTPEETVLRIFEKRLLATTGYGIVADHDVQSGLPIVPDAHYCYISEQGPVASTARPGTAGPDGVSIRGETLLAIADERLDNPAHAREAKVLMRALLAPLLGERPLASRALFRGSRTYTTDDDNRS